MKLQLKIIGFSYFSFQNMEIRECKMLEAPPNQIIYSVHMDHNRVYIGLSNQILQIFDLSKNVVIFEQLIQLKSISVLPFPIKQITTISNNSLLKSKFKNIQDYLCLIFETEIVLFDYKKLQVVQNIMQQVRVSHLANAEIGQINHLPCFVNHQYNQKPRFLSKTSFSLGKINYNFVAFKIHKIYNYDDFLFVILEQNQMHIFRKSNDQKYIVYYPTNNSLLQITRNYEKGSVYCGAGGAMQQAGFLEINLNKEGINDDNTQTLQSRWINLPYHQSLAPFMHYNANYQILVQGLQKQLAIIHMFKLPPNQSIDETDSTGYFMVDTTEKYEDFRKPYYPHCDQHPLRNDWFLARIGRLYSRQLNSQLMSLPSSQQNAENLRSQQINEEYKLNLTSITLHNPLQISNRLNFFTKNTPIEMIMSQNLGFGLSQYSQTLGDPNAENLGRFETVLYRFDQDGTYEELDRDGLDGQL